VSLAATRSAALLAAGALLFGGCGAARSRGGDPPIARTATAHLPDGDWLQFNYDAQRSGTGPISTGITAANVGTLKRRTVHLPGTADSAAIQLHAIRVKHRTRDVVIVTTSYGRTIAIDPGTGSKLWEFTPRDIHSYEGSLQITNASPTADPSRKYVYASSPDGYIHKLAVATGRQAWERKVTYDPTHEKLATPPTVSGGSLIVVTDGYLGDAPPYQGHVVTINRSSGRIEHVFNTLCSNRRHLIVPKTCGASDSAIWGRGGAVLEPGTNRILVATGNGPFNGHTDWGDSVLELSPDAAHLLHNFTPSNQAFLNSTDRDLGSTSPAVLPNPGGPPLAVQGGKDDLFKLLNLDRLDGTTGPAGPRTGGQLQTIGVPATTQLYTQPAVWVHSGKTYLFAADESATGAYVLHSGSSPQLSMIWQRNAPGTSPVLAGGLLYVYDQINGKLNVFDPLSGHQVASLGAASGHWNSPIVIGGRIILPVGNANDRRTSGELFIYHLP
jgi:outer membrane protein assembly factor BamB